MALKNLAGRAWVLLLIGGAALLLGGIVQLVADRPVASGLAFVQGNVGVNWDQLVASAPETATAILGFQRMLAIFVIAFAVLDLAVVATAYRRGERWAWYASWLNVAVFAGFVAVARLLDGWGASPSAEAAIVALLMLVAISVAGLVLPIRIFFPGRPRSASPR